MIEKSFSQLSISTATEIGEDENYRKLTDVRTVFYIDEELIPSGGSTCGLEKFEDKNLIYIIRYERSLEKESTTLRLNVYPKVAADWDILCQLRVQIGRDELSARVVDTYPLHLKPSWTNTSVRFADDSVRFVKLELRTIFNNFWSHPSFNQGDIELCFEDGSSLKTYKALLAQASSYIRAHISDPNLSQINIRNLPRNAMIELLLQLHRIPRSLCDNFEKLAQAATGFCVDLLIYRLNVELCTKGIKNFAEKCDAEMTKEKKWQEMAWKFAMETGLAEGLKQLIYDSVLSGDWDKRLAGGWQPEQFFSPGVLKELVKPTVSAARGYDLWQSMSNPWIEPDYFQPGAFKVPMMFRGTRFYVNQGIFQLLGADGFLRTERGELAARFTKEMEFVCGMTKTVPGRVVVALLNELHFGGPFVDSKQLKSAIVFCHNHGWETTKELLARRLSEPVNSAQKFLELVIFAERFGLSNLLTRCLYQAERSYHRFAVELAGKRFPGVSEKTRNRLIERLVVSWAQGPKPTLNPLTMRKEVEQMEREIRNGKGGPADADQDEPTMAEVISDYVFGPPVEFTLGAAL